MSNYSNNEKSVRVDFFYPSGKWYATEAIEWTGGYSGVLICDAYRKSIRDAVGDRYSGMTAICLDPYHEFSHPLCVKEW